MVDQRTFLSYCDILLKELCKSEDFATTIQKEDIIEFWCKTGIQYDWKKVARRLNTDKFIRLYGGWIVSPTEKGINFVRKTSYVSEYEKEYGRDYKEVVDLENAEAERGAKWTKKKGWIIFSVILLPVLLLVIQLRCGK